MFRTLRDRDGTPVIALDKDDLKLDGVIEPDGTIPDDKQMHVQRVGPRTYLVRDVRDGQVPSLMQILQGGPKPAEGGL